MYGCESWTLKKAEHRRIDAFELWCWRRLLKAPWTARRFKQSIWKEIGPECSLEGLMLKLKLQYLATWCKELTHLKRPWCWERLKAGGKGDDRGWDGWMASLTQWTWIWVNSGSWWWTGRPGVLQYMGLQRVRHDWATELSWAEHVGMPPFKGKEVAWGKVPYEFVRHSMPSTSGSTWYKGGSLKIWWTNYIAEGRSMDSEVRGMVKRTTSESS